MCTIHVHRGEHLSRRLLPYTFGSCAHVGLRAGFDGYLSEILGTLHRYRLQEQSVAAVREFGTENPFSGKTRTCLSELSCTK